jgi:hypothetical protein
MMSPEQERKKREALEDAKRDTYGVCATGEKYTGKEHHQYSDFPDQINNR